GLIGESGCGKSTFSRVVMQLIDPTEGEVYFEGEKFTKKNINHFRQKVQMVFQDPYSAVDPRMNVRKIIEEPLRVHTKLSDDEKLEVVLPILKSIGLTEEALSKYPHEFSGGQRQRICIARALVTKPDLLVCDEPVSALDVSIQASILNLFKEMQKELGLSYLFISHDMSVVKHVCDRNAVMYLGRIVELADKHELFANTKHPYSQALMSAIPVPDPTKQKARAMLKGEPPSPINPPDGCHFHERCPYATDICRTVVPELKDIGDNHFVACHLCGKEAAK
ncbi:MAG: ATP-binding cassette domain-containing protein, partial [Firmicutes bacterium]|nr:ATP-binding cassette domain-containing protein [Bacillota bacterium]